MADIFIFYASQDRPAAEALAKDLTARGYTVWCEISPPEAGEAQALIRSELEQAKAVIVIWSEDAVQSEWVCSGAAEARETSRLVQTIVEGFPARHIPLPFHVFDLTLLSDRDGIVRNLEKLSRIKREAPAWPEAERMREPAESGAALSAPPEAAPVECGPIDHAPVDRGPVSHAPVEAAPSAASAPPPPPPAPAAEAPERLAAAAPRPPRAQQQEDYGLVVGGPAGRAPVDRRPVGHAPVEAAPAAASAPPPPPPPPPAPAAKAPEQRAATAPRPPGARRQQNAARGEPLPVAGKLVENIPRRMRVAVHERVEVRLSREESAELLTAIEGRGARQSHDVQVTQAMSVMLRARTGTFHILNLSPETQWVYERPGVMGAKFGRWRWDVTPLKRGGHKLMLIVSARTARGDGVAGDVVLPDQVIEVAVRANVGQDLTRLGQWAGIAVAGGVLTEAVVWLVRLLTR